MSYHYYPTESCRTELVPENTKIWQINEIIRDYTPAWRTNDAGGQSTYTIGTTLIHVDLKVYRHNDDIFIMDGNGKIYNNDIYNSIKDQFTLPRSKETEYYFYYNGELKRAYPNK
jgi:hypothetical protein